MSNISKLEKRKDELVKRTSIIFGISQEEATNIFKQPLTSLVKVSNDNQVNEFIEEHIKNQNLLPIEWVKNAYVIKENKDVFTRSQEFQNGKIYIQNASSLIPVLTLNPLPNEKILDMCAAPGGKTINIAYNAQNQAEIIVNDENPTRVLAMKKLFNTYGVKITSFYSQPAQYLSKHLPANYFDKILLDAPCSGEGMIDLNKPETLGFWSTKKIKRLSRLQKGMIAEAYKLLKPEGVLVYSTCTLAPEENEEVISWAVNNLEGLKVENIELKTNITNSFDGLKDWKDKPLSEECSKCLRIKPNDYMEAFFVCKLTRKNI